MASRWKPANYAVDATQFAAWVRMGGADIMADLSQKGLELA